MVERLEDLRFFLAFLVSQYFEIERKAFQRKNREIDYSFPVKLFEKDIPFDFWKTLFSNYEILDRCKCNQSEYKICSTVYVKGLKKKGLFRNDYFFLNSNIGFFLFHIDDSGCLKECELLFEEDIIPSFLFHLVELFPSPDKSKDKLFLKSLNKKKIYSVDDLMKIFSLKDLETLEVD